MIVLKFEMVTNVKIQNSVPDGSRTRPTSITEIYRVSKTSVSAERRLSTVSENRKKNVLFQTVIGWFKQTGMHSNCKQKRAIFSLGDLSYG
jgi:hypothetical protein